jgi:hypothetical protein
MDQPKTRNHINFFDVASVLVLLICAKRRFSAPGQRTRERHGFGRRMIIAGHLQPKSDA